MKDHNNNETRKKQDEKRNAVRMLTLITQFGINMLVPIFLCFFAGLYLDRLLGTNYIMIILFFVGAIAGFTNIYKLAMKMTKKSEKELLLEKVNDISQDGNKTETYRNPKPVKKRINREQ